MYIPYMYMYICILCICIYTLSLWICGVLYVHTLSCLASFTSCGVSDFYPCCCVYRYFVSFYFRVVFHCMNVAVCYFLVFNFYE